MDMIPTRHEVTGRLADFPADALPAWRALGWIPLADSDGEPVASSETSTPTKAARARATTIEE